MVVVYEIILLVAGFLFGVFAVLSKHRKKMIPLYISSFLVGMFCVWIDLYVAQVIYYAKVFVPFTRLPLSMVIIGALYFCMILFVQELFIRRLKIHFFAKGILRILLIIVLNFLYPIVDLIIVRAKICVFHNKGIQMFYDSCDISNLPFNYCLSAYIFFFMGIMITGFLFIIFTNTLRLLQKYSSRLSG